MRDGLLLLMAVYNMVYETGKEPRYFFFLSLRFFLFIFYWSAR